MMFYNLFKLNILLILSQLLWNGITVSPSLRKDEIIHYKNRILSMFYHAYDGYIKHASDYDELQPLSCRGTNTWGSFSLSLIDALDTLALIGNYSEFKRVANVIIESTDFNSNINVSVFETNIRVIGGLLSAHLLSHKTGMVLEPGWPCSGPLLRLAENAARRLLPAFDTNTGMPYGTVNLRYGVPENETPITCTAGVGTFLVEFCALSLLTGDPVFQEKALNAIMALHKTRSKIGLFGNHINVQDSKWTATEAGIGAGVDSYFEYLVKGAILIQMPQLMEMFKEYYDAINKYLKKDDWYVWVGMNSGIPTMPVFQSLEAFWPGLLTLIGDIDQAKKSLYNYHQVWKQYGFVPEFYDIPVSKVTSKREGYPLRPEFAESVLYLYKATRDPHLLQIGADIVDSIYHSAKTECGYATIKSVDDHSIEDRMESFFLAETLKYLYLLFDDSNFMHNDGSKGTVIQTTNGDCIIDSGGYVFNTEAHPIDIATVYCCSPQKTLEDTVIGYYQNNIDLYKVLELSDRPDNSLEFLRQKYVRVPLDTDSSRFDNQNTEDINESINRETINLDLENHNKMRVKSEDIYENSETEINLENDNYNQSSAEIKSINDKTESSPYKMNNHALPTETNTNYNPSDNVLLQTDNAIEPSLSPSHDSSLEVTNLQSESETTGHMLQTEPLGQLNSSSVTSLSDEIYIQETITVDGTSSLSPETIEPTHSIVGSNDMSSTDELPEEVLTIIDSNPFVKNKLTKEALKILIDMSEDPKEADSKGYKMDIMSNNSIGSNVNFELLLCPSQHFLMRLSLTGQMIVDYDPK